MRDDMNRRQFIQYTGAAALSAASAAGCAAMGHERWAEDGVFPPAEPGRDGISAERVVKAVEFIDAEIEAGAIPGAALVATRRGRKFVEHYAGTYRSPDGTDQPFHRMVSSPLFSFSKGISATVVVMAHQDGLVDYDVPVSRYIPEFTGGGKIGRASCRERV